MHNQVLVRNDQSKFWIKIQKKRYTFADSNKWDLKKIMATLIINDNNSSAQQFLRFASTLPYVAIVEGNDISEKKVKRVVSNALKKSEQGKDLIVCKDINDMFRKLGI